MKFQAEVEVTSSGHITVEADNIKSAAKKIRAFDIGLDTSACDADFSMMQTVALDIRITDINPDDEEEAKV